MTDEEKVRAFLRANGVTHCPPMLAEDAYRQANVVCRKNGETKSTRPYHEMMPERRLAHAVILTALNDLGGRYCGANVSERDKLTYEALGWFKNRKDFLLWCDIAGFDPDYIRRKARDVVDSGLPPVRGPWRYTRKNP